MHDGDTKLGTETNLLTLSDGFRLCFAEYGDSTGKPVLMFHGNPGSRLAWGLMPGSPFMDGLRIIAPDRPGYGQTEFKKNALERWPQDMRELLNHLKIESATVFGPSGGAPYALSCAWKMPERVEIVGLFGPVGPNHPEAVKGALRSLQLLWRIAGPLQLLIRVQMWAFSLLAKRNPLKLASGMRDLELNETDKCVFDTPEVHSLFERDFPEAYRQNGIGSAYDASIPGSWPIPLEEIKTKVCIWRAENDQLVGEMPVYLHNHLPNSELHVIPDQGHLWVLNNMPVIMSKLLSQVVRSRH